MPRSPHDETGQRLIRAGKDLLRTGTSIEDLKLSHAVELASSQGERLTIGAAYPRFPGGQDEFRRAVLASFLHEAPQFRERGLDLLARVVTKILDERGAPDLLPEDVPRVIVEVAGEQQRLMNEDPDLPLRLYALVHLSLFEDSGGTTLGEELHARDTRMNQEWAGVVGTLCKELGVRPRASLDHSDFEIAVSSLLSGLALRQRTTELPEGLYGRLLMALVLGFFDTPQKARKPLHERVVDFFRGDKPLRKTTRRLARLVTSTADAGQAAAGLPPSSRAPSEPVRRALAASRSRD